jgi:hypothetical protein
MATTGTGPHRAPRKTPTCPVNIYVAFFRAECRDGDDPYTAAEQQCAPQEIGTRAAEEWIPGHHPVGAIRRRDLAAGALTAADTVELNSVGFPTHKGAGE